jgi:glycosyltransferase involved in cell wall biosynthesis
MNVGVVVHNYDRHEGTGGYTVELVERLATRHEVTLYAAGFQTRPPDGVTVVRVPALRLRAYVTVLTFPPAFAAVRRRHDVVHAQGWVTRNADVVTAHVVLAAWRSAARVHGVRSALGERLLGDWVSRRERALMRGARAVIAPSERAKRDIARCYCRREGVRVIPHGCDRKLVPLPRVEARASLGVPPGAFVALYLGDARKGLRAAIGGLAAAPAVHLLAVTATPPDSYLRLADVLGVRDRLIWAPRGAGAAEAYGAADVLVHPTIHDSFGLTVAEALTFGIPAIVSREAGVSDLLQHRRSAWLLEEPSAAATGRALQTLSENQALCTALAAGGREVAAAYTWDRAVRATESVYEEARRR